MFQSKINSQRRQDLQKEKKEKKKGKKYKNDALKQRSDQQKIGFIEGENTYDKEINVGWYKKEKKKKN